VLRAKENPVLVTVTLPVAEEIAPAETATKPAAKGKGKK
jgi:hypothetical protein